MTDDRFRIFVEQLRNGSIEEIDETVSPDFLDINERELSFSKPVNVCGQVYLAEDMLVFHLDIHTVATIPCAICNGPADIVIAIKGFYHAVPLSEIKGAIYDFREILRESILLEVPILAECHQGRCPQRDSLEKYFKKEGAPGSKEDEDGYRPFAGLDFDFKDK
jgi:uncharacterized metal-binding protein YceD (DUF177 family)